MGAFDKNAPGWLVVALQSSDTDVTHGEIMAWWNKHREQDERRMRVRMAVVERRAPMLPADLGY